MAKFSWQPTPRPPETTMPRRGELGPVRGRDLVLDPGRQRRVGGGRRRLDRGGRLRARRLEGGAAHGQHLLRVARLHRLDRVAGVDRPLEGVGAEHAGHLGDHHHVEHGRQPGGHVLARRGAREDDVLVGTGQRDDQLGQRLRQPVGVGRTLDVDHLGDPVERRGLRRDRGAAVAGDEDVDLAAEALRGGHRLGRRVVQRRVVVLGEHQDGHQITPASVLSFSSSSSTEPTFTPALRVAGSTVFSTFSRGATSTP